jgi:hypothetical protein
MLSVRNRFVEGLLGFFGFHAERESFESRLIRNGLLDRRRFPRVKCHHLVKCCYVNDGHRDWVTNLKDISEGGLKLWTPEKLQCNDIVKFVIFFARLDYQVTAAARMVWSQPISYDGQGHVAGFSFLAVKLSQQDFLHKYVRAHLN